MSTGKRKNKTVNGKDLHYFVVYIDPSWERFEDLSLIDENQAKMVKREF